MERERYYYKVASPAYIRQADEVFNEQLARQIAGSLDTNHIYQLGRPGIVLQAAGFPDNRIELLARHLTKKAVQKNHPFFLGEVKGMVAAINNPIAVFAYGANSKAQNVIIEQESQGKKFLIGVHFNQEYRGTTVSDIRGVFPKDYEEWVNWIQQGKTEYINKEKVQNLITEQRSSLAEVSHLDLDFVAKVIKNFENPKFSMENVMVMDDYFNENRYHIPLDIEKAIPDVIKERITDSGMRDFTPRQKGLIVSYLKDHVDEGIEGMERIYETACKDDAVKDCCKEWKEQAWDEITEIYNHPEKFEEIIKDAGKDAGYKGPKY